MIGGILMKGKTAFVFLMAAGLFAMNPANVHAEGISLALSGGSLLLSEKHRTPPKMISAKHLIRLLKITIPVFALHRLQITSMFVPKQTKSLK